MTATVTQPLCEFCREPFAPVPFDLPGPGGSLLAVKTTACPRCAKAKALKTPASLAPVKVADVRTRCLVCNQEFMAEAVEFPGDGKMLKPALSHATVCDSCAEIHIVPPASVNPTQEDRRRKMWVGMTGVRYADFNASELPAVIQPHAERVLAWTVQSRGIGLIGPSRSGKSPLMYALGQKLFVEGVDVLPTSGIEFQRKYQRSFEKGESKEWQTYLKDCEECAVLLLDDADKLNLTPGVEAEYYGMLEHRRNWQLPVLCTLNLTGKEIVDQAKARGDRAAAIVERLKDLCEFIPVS